MRTLEYHSDKGCRPGYHPVSIVRTDRKGRNSTEHYFSVDEPGAWFDDQWNCHVDGCDYPCATREEAVQLGADVLYQQMFHGSPAIVILYRNKPFHQ